jgi:Fe-S-cluster-containing hydrogenase component 2/CRP-like cAMP-binding protein
VATVQANLPALREQESAPAEPGDEALTAEELGSLSLFSGSKRAPSFEKFPGTTFLRKAYAGRIICEQGDKGSTAFYVLTADDVLALREKQLASVRQLLEVAPDQREKLHTYFGRLGESELRRLADEFASELEDMRRRAEERRTMSESQLHDARQALTVHLLSEQEQDQLRSGFWRRLFGKRSKRRSAASHGASPAVVPVDAPVDADDHLYEGDLFGEMSCLNRAPRSATVIASRDCYLLEILRNVLDQVRRDPEQKQRMDENYRQRVLRTHLAQLSFFAGVAPDSRGLERLRDQVELVMYEPGDVVFEEHDPSDAIYVVRTGLMKIVKNVGCQLREGEFKPDQFIDLCCQLVEVEQERRRLEAAATLRKLVWDALSDAAKDVVRSVAPRADAGDAERSVLREEIQRSIARGPQAAEASSRLNVLLDELNRFIREGAVHESLGKTTDQAAEVLQSRAAIALTRGFPERTENWSDLERRLFHRLVLETACPRGIPARAASNPPMQTLIYGGPGTVFGEMGVFLAAPRSATCIAYDHPDGKHDMRVPDSRTGARPSQLELVRIPRAAFVELMNDFPELKKRVEAIVHQRKSRSLKRREQEGAMQSLLTGTAEFEALGLIQGQKLMVVDLDRCTRCGDCVSACVKAHDDGNTRLYLDGPRFGNYLVPLSCRKCLDPVCMIGCPVGSINRGENGEIIIRDWCIGCSLCADQCPYGSIQITPLARSIELSARQRELLPADTSVKEVQYRAVVCDLCSSLATGPACVYACPHDAAIRVNASQFFAQDPS